MFQDPHFQQVKRFLYHTSSHPDVEKINIPEILNSYVHIYYGHSILRDDAFLMLAMSIIIKKRMRKLRLEIVETRNQMFESKTENSVKKQHRQRREQIVVNNQLIRLPEYFSQNHSQLAEETSIQLPSQQQSNHSQQDFIKMEVEVEGAPQLVSDYRDLLKNQTKFISTEQQQEYKTEVKQKGLNQYYELLMEQDYVEEVNAKKAKKQNSYTYKKLRPKADLNMEINSIAYRSQFNTAIDQDINFLLDQLQDYLVNDFRFKQSDCVQKKDSLFDLIKTLLDDDSFQNSIEHFLRQQDNSNKSQSSIKSIMMSRNSEDSQERKQINERQIQFIVEEQQGLYEIKEEVSRQFNTSWSQFREKSSYDKAQQFYHMLCDVKNNPNMRISQINTENFGPISVSYK